MKYIQYNDDGDIYAIIQSEYDSPDCEKQLSLDDETTTKDKFVFKDALSDKDPIPEPLTRDT